MPETAWRRSERPSIAARSRCGSTLRETFTNFRGRSVSRRETRPAPSLILPLNRQRNRGCICRPGTKRCRQRRLRRTSTARSRLTIFLMTSLTRGISPSRREHSASGQFHGEHTSAKSVERGKRLRPRKRSVRSKANCQPVHSTTGRFDTPRNRSPRRVSYKRRSMRCRMRRLPTSRRRLLIGGCG